MIASQSFRSGRNWLVWEEKHRPMSALTGRQAGWNRNLAPYNEAVQFVLNNSNTFNLGYCFTADQPFIGLDIDSCRNPATGEVQDWAARVIEALSPYTVLENVSVSGTGVKLIIRSETR